MPTITNVNEKGYFENTVRPNLSTLDKMREMDVIERRKYISRMKFDDVDKLIDIIDFLSNKLLKKGHQSVVKELSEIRKDLVIVNSNNYRIRIDSDNIF